MIQTETKLRPWLAYFCISKRFSENASFLVSHLNFQKIITWNSNCSEKQELNFQVSKVSHSFSYKYENALKELEGGIRNISKG